MLLGITSNLEHSCGETGEGSLQILSQSLPLLANLDCGQNLFVNLYLVFLPLLGWFVTLLLGRQYSNILNRTPSDNILVLYCLFIIVPSFKLFKMTS